LRSLAPAGELCSSHARRSPPQLFLISVGIVVFLFRRRRVMDGWIGHGSPFPFLLSSFRHEMHGSRFIRSPPVIILLRCWDQQLSKRCRLGFGERCTVHYVLRLGPVRLPPFQAVSRAELIQLIICYYTSSFGYSETSSWIDSRLKWFTNLYSFDKVEWFVDPILTNRINKPAIPAGTVPGNHS
jgi:hypothetical protein